jgi:hypothetical protein
VVDVVDVDVVEVDVVDVDVEDMSTCHSLGLISPLVYRAFLKRS